jgi:hypothetical protein
MKTLQRWNLKGLIFWNLCVAQCADEPEMLLKALSIVWEVGVS